MAILLRCCCRRPPASGSLSRRVSGGTRSPEKYLLIPFKREKVAAFPIHVQASSEKWRIWSSNEFIWSNRDAFQMANSEEIYHIDGKQCGIFCNINEFISDHQRMMSFSFLKAFILTNSLMLILPSKVLAETCEADNSFYNMPLLFAIAMIGATVGGLLARQRRGELQRLNDQLRQINAALRRQAKIESYAPNLSYAPVGSRMAESEVIVDPRKEQLMKNLKKGKNFLRNQDAENAFTEFKAALELAKALGDYVEEKKAARGLGASLQRQGKYREAIKYHSMVLDIAKRVGEDSGSTEAYGAIADCYTELGELEQAGKFYDQYIARLEND